MTGGYLAFRASDGLDAKLRPTSARRGRFYLAALVLVGLVTLPACDSSEPNGDNGPPSVNGTFGGTVAGTNDTISVRVSIQEADSPIGGKSITGSGTLTTPSEVATFDISGSYVHPLIELDLEFGDRPPGTVSGQVSESRLQITATVTAPGVGGQVTLRKESA